MALRQPSVDQCRSRIRGIKQKHLDEIRMVCEELCPFSIEVCFGVDEPVCVILQETALSDLPGVRVPFGWIVQSHGERLVREKRMAQRRSEPAVCVYRIKRAGVIELSAYRVCSTARVGQDLDVERALFEIRSCQRRELRRAIEVVRMRVTKGWNHEAPGQIDRAIDSSRMLRLQCPSDGVEGSGLEVAAGKPPPVDEGVGGAIPSGRLGWSESS